MVADHTFHEIHIPQLTEPSKLISPAVFNQSPDMPLRHVMLSLRVRGRTGNQLFQWASAAGIASANNVSYCIYGLELGKFFDGPFPPSCTRVPRRIHKEKGFGIYEPLKISEDTMLEGYFQSYKNFQHIDIRGTLRFKSTYLQKARKIIRKINTTSVNTIIGVHVRRGDYTSKAKLRYLRFPPVSYFMKAMDYYRRKYSAVKFIVVSNEIQWVRSHAVFKGSDTVLSSTGDAIVDLAILANCDHGVMSIGSFGWWANFLAGGECIYYQNEFVLSHPEIKGKFKHEDYYIPHWKPLGDH